MPEKETMPDITIYSWMRTALGISGIELIIFAYLFTKTFDNVHRCFTSLDTFSEWFGVTRQAISRHMKNLVNAGMIDIVTYKNEKNTMLKHNSYIVKMDRVTELCEADEDSYKKFLFTYSNMLKNKYPKDTMAIDSYIDKLFQWHKVKDIELCVTLSELANMICEETDTVMRFTDVLNLVRDRESKLHRHRASSFTARKMEDCNSDTGKLVEQQKARRKTDRSGWQEKKAAMTDDFVTMRLGGNAELRELIFGFLDTTSGRSYSPKQWEQQLETMYTHGRTIERMIDGVRRSYMNNYRSLYLVDKSEVDIPQKLVEISVYVNSNADGDNELQSLLEAYVTETSKGKGCSINQFRLMLENLSEICTTTEQKIESVKRSYSNSYAALAYKSSNNGQYQATNAEVDIDKKKEAVSEFIKSGYYQLCDGLEKSLISYIENTQNGRSMPYESFCIALENLRLFCFDDIEKVSRVRTAIQTNANRFATEDYAETNKLKARLETRETMAKSLDRTRKQKVETEKMRNPDDDRLKDVVIVRRVGVVI